MACEFLLIYLAPSTNVLIWQEKNLLMNKTLYSYHYTTHFFFCFSLSFSVIKLSGTTSTLHMHACIGFCLFLSSDSIPQISIIQLQAWKILSFFLFASIQTMQLVILVCDKTSSHYCVASFLVELLPFNLIREHLLATLKYSQPLHT